MIDPIYRAVLEKAFLDQRHCYAIYLETIPVVETWGDLKVRTGDVEAFTLVGHPQAKKGYAWVYDRSKGSEIVTVLELPPVASAQTAVRAAIVARVQSGEQN